MALVTQSIKNLKGGVSQQPDILRFPNQGAYQENGWSSETQGLQKRPPSIHVKRLGNQWDLGLRPLVHMINRDENEQYNVVFTGVGVRVFDLKTGHEYSVVGYDNYANCERPRTDLRMITVADFTFVTNRKAVVRQGSDLTHPGSKALNTRCVINVRGGQYGRTLKFGINGSDAHAILPMPAGDVADYPNPPPDTPTKQVEWTDAGFIARELAKRFNANMVALGWAYRASAGQGFIVVDGFGEVINSVHTDDGYGGQLLNAFIYQVQTFNKLPAQCEDGYLVEITGEAAKSGDNYWVQYNASGLVWKEVAKPGITAGLNKGTMPRALVRVADGNFEWRQLDWDVRRSGDDDTNPMPSFLDATINEIFFFRNRLGFLSGENVIMSRTSKYFNFFPSSVAQVSDDDPIDVAISHNRVSILKYAVPFSEQLLLWSDQAQFVLSSAGTMTAKSIQLDLTTEFDVRDGARPFGIGRGVYFASPRASYTSIKRYYAVQDVSDVKSAEDISGHIPVFIKNEVFSIHGSGTENFVAVLSDGDPGRLFVYKFLYVREELEQQSWSFWTFGDGARILGASCIGSYLYLTISRPSGITMERIEFTENTADLPGEPYRTYMDSKLSVTAGAFDEDLYETHIDVYDIYEGPMGPEVVLYTVDSLGVFQRHESPTGWTKGSLIRLNGDRSGEVFTVGREFKFHYEFSKFLIKKTADDGSTSTEDSGRLQLRKAWLNYELSGAFTVSVDNGSTEYRYVMSGAKVGHKTIIGEPVVGTGQFRFPVTGNALTQTVSIHSSTPTPLNVIGCGWEGNYIRRSSGI